MAWSRQSLRRSAMRALPKPGQQVQSHHHPRTSPEQVHVYYHGSGGSGFDSERLAHQLIHHLLQLRRHAPEHAPLTHHHQIHRRLRNHRVSADKA